MKPELTDFEKEHLRIIKKFQRLSATRVLYNKTEAAFKLNVSVHRLDEEYLIKYKMLLVQRGNDVYIPHSEIERVNNILISKRLVLRGANAIFI